MVTYPGCQACPMGKVMVSGEGGPQGPYMCVVVRGQSTDEGAWCNGMLTCVHSCRNAYSAVATLVDSCPA
jgi:hypothetical protein